MSPNLNQIFVYGILLNGERSHELLRPCLLASEPASIRGELWLVEDEDYPYLTPGYTTVHGELHTIIPEKLGRLLEKLDEFEDYLPDDESNSLYLRRESEVLRLDGRSTMAWTYWWNNLSHPGKPLPGGDFRLRHGKSL